MCVEISVHFLPYLCFFECIVELNRIQRIIYLQRVPQSAPGCIGWDKFKLSGLLPFLYPHPVFSISKKISYDSGVVALPCCHSIF